MLSYRNNFPCWNENVLFDNIQKTKSKFGDKKYAYLLLIDVSLYININV